MVEAQILVVEDETIVAMEIQDRLKGLGYHIAAVVSSGEEAIRKAAETKPDLALMDVVLKGSMDGVEAAEHIRTRFNIPVIYLTAYADDVTFQRAKTTEPYGYIIKPFEERELYTAIEMALYKHQVERKLKESEERYRFLYEDNPSMYFTVDTEGTVLSVNQFGAEQLGYTVEELKGQSVLKFFHPDDQKAVLEQLSMCLNNPSQIARWEFRKVRKDRSIMWVSETARAIRDADGRTVILIVCEDITEKRKLEEELLKTQKLESIGILAGGIAHDFNNILTAIMGNISLAKADINPASEAFEILTEAEKASLRARELAHKLLTFSKGGAPVKDIVSIADLIKDSTAFALSGSNVRCEFSLPDHLWAVEADVSQLSQVIQNLVINAIQAMPEGGTIQIYAENIFLGLEHGLPLQPGNYVKLSVVDSGVGIPAQHLPKIFDPYFTTKKKGTGLGLATAYSIIKKHGGYITVESEVDVGTTFYIYLPASENPLPAKEKAEKV
ncbi:MAG: PAS domain S-box protein, partial [candidate division KSB1 bacterium]|nr:PAS domain S-box protein [candidate division KSB1 bacterium]